MRRDVRSSRSRARPRSRRAQDRSSPRPPPRAASRARRGRAMVTPGCPAARRGARWRPSAPGEGEREVVRGVGPPLDDLEAGGGELRRDPIAMELGADLGAQLLAGCEVDVETKALDVHLLCAI